MKSEHQLQKIVTQCGRVWRYGCVPSSVFFLFSSSKWSDLVHSMCYFFTVRLPVLRKMTELMALKWEAAAWSAYSRIRERTQPYKARAHGAP